MAKVADKIFINSSAKVQHFCELCKKKSKKIYTISVNITLQKLYTILLFANNKIYLTVPHQSLDH